MQTQGIGYLAMAARSFFVDATRADDGSQYVKLSDDAPVWVREMVREAHGEFLPDDWRYETIKRSLMHIAYQNPDDLDDAHEFADGNVDAYTSELLRWLGYPARVSYCDEAIDEMGWPEERSILDIVRMGQYVESCEVYSSVVSSLRARVDR